MAVIFVLIGAIAAWMMLDRQGNPKKKTNVSKVTGLHKMAGYLFILIYAIMCVLMIAKISGYQQDFPPRATLHIVFALFLTPMILLKLGIVKRLTRFYSYLPVLGSLILATAFVLTGITSGYYFLHRSKIRYTSVSDNDRNMLDTDIGKKLLLTKCGKCHTPEIVFTSIKNSDGWTKTVNRMAQKDAPNIRPFDVKQIVYYLASRDDKRRRQLEAKPKKLTGEALVQSKCGGCHDLVRVNSAKKDSDAWKKTVDQMIENAEEIGMTDFLTDKETVEIVEFLSSRK